MRQAVQFVELDIDWCSLSYGVGACPAVLGVDSPDKCFNTRHTCPVPASFASSTVTLRFGEASALPALAIEVIPGIRQIGFTPARINPGEDLGQRAVLRVTVGEQKHSDTGDGFDKYHAERAYNPYEQGTLWGKFRARQPYLRTNAIRWYLGYSDQSLSEMECRHFIVESFDGPTEGGTYTLVAVDPLKMLDGDRAMAPAANTGRLTADITDVDVSATLTPAGIGDLSYQTSGSVAISGSEAVSFTRIADTLTLTARGQFNTTADEHTAGDRVQTILEYVSEDPADILYDLMVNYAGVPVDYIPLAEWQAETATYLRREYTGRIAEPTPVRQLVDELIQQCGLSIWWDDIAGQIKLRVLRGISSSGILHDDGSILDGTFSRREQPDKRVSQVWVFFGQKNPLAGQEQTDNYRQFTVEGDANSETNYGSASIRRMFSRWIPPGGQSAAERAGKLLIGKLGDPPRLFNYQLMRDAQDTPLLGSAAATSWRTEQAADGSQVEVPTTLVQVTPGKTKFAVVAEEDAFASLDPEDLTTRSITINYDTLDVNMRSMHDELFPDPTDGITVNFIVETNTYVGASQTSIPALQTGIWPTKAVTGNRTSGSPTLTGIVDTTGLAVGQRVSGTGIPDGAAILSIVANTSITLDMNATSGAATSTALTVYTVILNVIIRGHVLGRGGPGGTGANGQGNLDGTDGGAGGTALDVDYPIFLTDTDGEIGGGGGGGGGGPCRDPNDHRGGGGGGGQGELGGDGGVGPGNGRDGNPGSRTAAGVGGHGWTNNNIFAGPSDDSTRRGGDGGDLGDAGQNGQGSSDLDKGNGGAAGAAIDGISQVVTVGVAGSRLGSQIN